MKDALGSVQSVLVLGGGSDIARATCRELVGRRG
ncbi:MAG TPA: decaprenylphospho-beta-D-erythro-pentofuranosid-2-ulose 2-reductase, partial [Acidimicrobiia bacterium]|nr:decaprenylphospho-beta-D-erythro-pentofuranosid-2-ulose 2-reductase [Acidimicrobiia bacterium]